MYQFSFCNASCRFSTTVWTLALSFRSLFCIEHEILSSESNLLQALGQTADWFRRALSVEPVKGNLRLSGYSACGQDGGVQLPREYVEGIFIAIECLLWSSYTFLVSTVSSCYVELINILFIQWFSSDGVADADLVLLVTTRPTTGNTLAWAVACERDQWGRAIAGNFFIGASFGLEYYLTLHVIEIWFWRQWYFSSVGHVNVAPRHLTAEAETLLSATLIHEVSWLLYIWNLISIGSSISCSSTCFWSVPGYACSWFWSPCLCSF